MSERPPYYPPPGGPPSSGHYAPGGYPPPGYGGYPAPGPHGYPPGTPQAPYRPEPPPPLPTPVDPEALRRSRARARFFWRHLFPYLLLVVIFFAVSMLVVRQLRLAPGEMRFKQGWVLLLLLAIPLLCWASFHLEIRRLGSFIFPRVRDLMAVGSGALARLRSLPAVLRIVALAMIIFALAQPFSQRKPTWVQERLKGIDIMLALDVSMSMQDSDLTPPGSMVRKTRLDVAKQVIDAFIRKRKTDRIGLVLFGKEAYTWCPPTLDYTALRTLLGEVRLGIIDGRATAIGDALGTAINRLRPRDEKKKKKRQPEAKKDEAARVIILLTDGDNNAGTITPNQAANFARTFKVKIFTILVGRHGGSSGGLFGRRRFRVNPRLLEEIAALTGGTPYRATDQRALKDRFQRILDTLRKDVRMRKRSYKGKELYTAFLYPAIFLIFLDILLGLIVFRRFP